MAYASPVDVVPTSLTCGIGRSGPLNAAAIWSASYQERSGPKRTTSSSVPARKPHADDHAPPVSGSRSVGASPVCSAKKRRNLIVGGVVHPASIGLLVVLDDVLDQPAWARYAAFARSIVFDTPLSHAAAMVTDIGSGKISSRSSSMPSKMA